MQFTCKAIAKKVRKEGRRGATEAGGDGRSRWRSSPEGEKALRISVEGLEVGNFFKSSQVKKIVMIVLK